MPQRIIETSCSLHTVHLTSTDYFWYSPFRASIFVYMCHSLPYFRSSVQCNPNSWYSVTAFHIHPQSTSTLPSKLLSSGQKNKKGEVNTLVQGKEQLPEIKPLFNKAAARFRTKDSSAVIRPQMNLLLPEKEIHWEAVDQSGLKYS